MGRETWNKTSGYFHYSKSTKKGGGCRSCGRERSLWGGVTGGPGVAFLKDTEMVGRRECICRLMLFVVYLDMRFWRIGPALTRPVEDGIDPTRRARRSRNPRLGSIRYGIHETVEGHHSCCARGAEGFSRWPDEELSNKISVSSRFFHVELTRVQGPIFSGQIQLLAVYLPAFTALHGQPLCARNY